MRNGNPRETAISSAACFNVWLKNKVSTYSFQNGSLVVMVTLKKCTGFHSFQPLSFGNYSPFIGVEENETHSNGNSVSKVTEFTYHFRDLLMLWEVVWFFHYLCTYMNFAVHLSGSSAFTFTVYFLVCLIRWLCWLYLNSLYFYAGF